MTATLDASAAVVKVQYNKGVLPKALYKRTKARLYLALDKDEKWGGGDWKISLNSECPQGLGADYSVAAGSIAQGTYAQYTIPRKEYFAHAQITWHALKAAEEAGEESFVALWKNETECVALQGLIDHEIFLLGNGTGVLGAISSGSTVGNATITLATPSDAAKFALNMRVQAVSSTTSLSPTIRSGFATITAIDRAAGTLTVSTTWSGQITGVATGDGLVRAGNAAVSGTATVLTGWEGWITQSATTLHGLNTTPDPVRYTGQVYDAAGVQPGEALIEMAARIGQQGGDPPTLALGHSRDLANWKKQLESRRTYTQTKIDTEVGVSIPAIVVEGDEGEIKVVGSPFVTRYHAQVMDPAAWKLRSLGAVMRVMNFDGNDMLRVPDASIVRMSFWSAANLGCTAPYGQGLVTNFGN